MTARSDDLPVPLRPMRPMRSALSSENAAPSRSGSSPYARLASSRVSNGMRGQKQGKTLFSTPRWHAGPAGFPAEPASSFNYCPPSVRPCFSPGLLVPLSVVELQSLSDDGELDE